MGLKNLLDNVIAWQDDYDTVNHCNDLKNWLITLKVYTDNFAVIYSEV